MDFTNWGNYHFINDNYAIVYDKFSNKEYHIYLYDTYNMVEIKVNDIVLLTFKDELNNKADLTTFTRTSSNHTYIYMNGNLILKKVTKKVKFLKRTNRDMHNSKNFITMDLETRVQNGVMRSYCVSIYDGKEFNSFYLTEYSNEKEMLRASILYLMKRRYNNFRVYLHNFSRFDSVFLLSVLTDLSDKIQPIIRDGRLINLSFKFANKYTLFFRDSYLLLPDTLQKLANNFKVANKGLFPYKFVNDVNISLDYIGNVPEFKFFEKVSIHNYQIYASQFSNNNWSLKQETINYCQLDCFVLYQILDKFSDEIFRLFRIDILKYSTLSSLAFSIYKTNYLKDNKIPLIHGEMYDFIKRSYTGGSVDVYKPYSNKKTYSYDVNSLYPHVMKNFPMPVGTPTYFEGDILHNLDSDPKNKPFGVFEVDIVAPSNIKYPLLQTRIKTKNGFRTISPLVFILIYIIIKIRRTWSGVYFSDELYNAAKYGYTFTVKRGYLFERGNIFTEFVDFLYTLKKKSQKGTPNYTISKLLLNSLYGRLGMDPKSEQHIILNNEKATEFYNNVEVTNVLDFNNGKELISFYNNPSEEYDDEDFDIKETSVVIASIITASARIHMSIFKTKYKLIIYYTDTDSIVVDIELDPKLIGEELGLLKLEHVFDEAIFLAPKMYGGKTSNYEYVRIKGLKNPLPFEELKPLLKKDSFLEIKQEKWYSDYSKAIFNVKDEIYTLMVTDNKRELIYNEEGLFIDTA